MFHLLVGEMTVTLQDASYLLGLPHAGRAMATQAVGSHWRQEILQRFAGVIEPGEDEPPQMEFSDKHGTMNV